MPAPASNAPTESAELTFDARAPPLNFATLRESTADGITAALRADGYEGSHHYVVQNLPVAQSVLWPHLREQYPDDIVG